MDINDILKSHETRILDLEVTSRDHEGKIAKLDDKAESAWHRIRETQQDISRLNDKVDELLPGIIAELNGK